VIPGANRASAALDLARTVVRRAERLYVAAPIEGSSVGPYLNRLSDLLWAMARWVEGDEHLLARVAPRGRRSRVAKAAKKPAGGSGDGGTGVDVSGGGATVAAGTAGAAGSAGTAGAAGSAGTAGAAGSAGTAGAAGSAGTKKGGTHRAPTGEERS
jgi:Cobalamin adenosyltransferase